MIQEPGKLPFGAKMPVGERMKKVNYLSLKQYPSYWTPTRQCRPAEHATFEEALLSQPDHVINSMYESAKDAEKKEVSANRALHR